MQYSVLTRKSGHTVHPDKVCLTVSCMHAHPVRGLASPRTLDYNRATVLDNNPDSGIAVRCLAVTTGDESVCYILDCNTHITLSNAARVLAAPVLQVGHICICECEMHDRLDSDGTSTADCVDLAALEAL